MRNSLYTLHCRYMELSKAISSILFYRAEPMTIKRLSVLLKYPENEVLTALDLLETKAGEVGLRLVRNGDEVTLGTATEASALIESITKEELSRDLSKAALETLAIVLYNGPLTRSEIDYIRGVNSTFILRNLLVRGLVEKVENPNDQRSFHYKSTFQLLEYMGVGKIEDLPDYHDTIAQLGVFMSTKEVEKVEQKSESSEPGERVPEASQVADEMESNTEELEEDADIWEEDMAGGGFDDEGLRAHTESDKIS